MIVLTLIATIIHMNAGFPLLEALGRGFVSALMVCALGFVLYVIGVMVLGIVSTIGRR